MMMIPLASLSQSASIAILATVFGSTTLVDNVGTPSMQQQQQQQQQQPIPVLEVIKVYGKLAGPECYGEKSPLGASCEMTLHDVEKTFLNFGGSSSSSTISEKEFLEMLNRAEFQWPLKPYGIDKSLTKTVTMNKGAETKVYMDLLEERGLYDPRNPTGPLPTSLRPQLNRQLQKEGVNEEVSQRIFEALGGRNGELKAEKLVEKLGGGGMDYYGFLELVGKESVVWPY